MSKELEAQRRSFAYGNTSISNPDITREMVDEEAEKLATETVQVTCPSCRAMFDTEVAAMRPIDRKGLRERIEEAEDWHILLQSIDIKRTTKHRARILREAQARVDTLRLEFEGLLGERGKE